MIISFFVPLISISYASSVLEKVSSVWRLKGPKKAPQNLRTEFIAKGSGACQGGAQLNLILSFSTLSDAEKWIEFESFVQDGPCETKAYPINEGYELRFSYRAKSNEVMQTLSYQTSGAWIVDHWKVSKPSKVNTVKTRVVKKEEKAPPEIINNPLVGFTDQVVDLYSDQESWKKILGQSGKIVSFESPELDRFRVAVSSLNVDYDKLPRHKRSLRPPLISLPMLDGELDFSEEKLELPQFELKDLKSENLQSASAREQKLALEGLNYLRKLIERKEWLKARESLDVLEKGNVRSLIPTDSARWWALKGHIYKKLGEEIKNTEISNQGLEYWREGIRSTAGKGSGEQAYANYMVLESLRTLFDSQLYYPAAAILAWAQKYRWSPSVEERLDYLRGEVHYRLGLMDEAHEYFSDFLKRRKDVPLSASFDRRLVPLASFRNGDSLLRKNEFKNAIREYSHSFGNILSQSKVSFEGAWFPEEIRYYPQVLFHRAEASLRVGNIPEAMSDLRAFVNFALDHPNLSFVLYRLADLLEWVGAPEEKIDGAWRECVFRSGGDIGGRLCKARQSLRNINKDNRRNWPRYVADVEDVLSARNLDNFEDSFLQDVRLYIRILLADAFLKADDAFQSFEQTQKGRGIEASEDLRLWLREYRVSAMSGYMKMHLELGRFQDLFNLYKTGQNPPGVDIERPELVWPLVNAYVEMGTWKSAHEFVERGVAANREKRPASDRKYLPSEFEWKHLQARIELRLLAMGDLRAQEVQKTLKALGRQNTNEVLRLWQEYYQLQKDTRKEEEVYAKILKQAIFSNQDHLRYVFLLKQNNKNQIAHRHLESYIAPQLNDLKESEINSNLQALSFELFESRERQQQFNNAEVILNSMIKISDIASPLSREQLLYRRGSLLNKMGRIDDARQSFENAKTLAPDSVWGKLSQNELQSLEI